jgi:Ca2+-binding EF-hand superfamily protein
MDGKNQMAKVPFSDLRSHSGMLSPYEQKTQQHEQMQVALESTFKKYDRDDSGFIELNELKELLRADLKLPLTDDECKLV